MNGFLYLILSLVFLLPPCRAATIQSVWRDEHNPSKTLNQQNFNSYSLQNFLFGFLSSNFNIKTQNEFRIATSYENNQTNHVRYNQYFKGIPVWGAQLITHHNKKTKMTGNVVNDLDKDITSIQTKLNEATAYQIALRAATQNNHKFSKPRFISQQKYIYVDHNKAKSKAVIAYQVSFFMDDLTENTIKHPVYMIDANHGTILMHYDNLQKLRAAGTGLGGNDLTRALNKYLPRATNAYQFGNAIPNLPSFGTLPVEKDGLFCKLSTDIVNVRSIHNLDYVENFFPITYAVENSIPVYDYVCASAPYQNLHDGFDGPLLNKGFKSFSPNNDVFYFANETYNMLRTYMPDIANPWGPALPIRIYTHIGGYDNAAAISSTYRTDFPPQFIVGNGVDIFYPLSDANTVAHELGHIFTTYHSHLIYAGQPGAINEAFSDITGATFDAYLNERYPWYGFNFAVGPSVSLPTGKYAGKPIRYMMNPTLDNHSIRSAQQYDPTLDVHSSSGVFNKAFFIMVALQKIPIMRAFQYFSYANANYWTPITNFNLASCGVMQAALDQNNVDDYHKIISAFKRVGVHCKVGALL